MYFHPPILQFSPVTPSLRRVIKIWDDGTIEPSPVVENLAKEQCEADLYSPLGLPKQPQ
jgi:hypothetical protein